MLRGQERPQVGIDCCGFVMNEYMRPIDSKNVNSSAMVTGALSAAAHLDRA
jgi:hypothetical protein